MIGAYCLMNCNSVSAKLCATQYFLITIKHYQYYLELALTEAGSRLNSIRQPLCDHPWHLDGWEWRVLSGNQGFIHWMGWFSRLQNNYSCNGTYHFSQGGKTDPNSGGQKTIETSGLDMNMIAGATADGANSAKSLNAGLAAIQIWCVSHHLNIALKNVVEKAKVVYFTKIFIF